MSHQFLSHRHRRSSLRVLLALILVGCSQAGTTVGQTGDAGEITGDAGNTTADGGSTPVDGGVAPEDAGPLTETYDCSAIEANEDWDLCGAGTDSCAAVFYDGVGCHEVCASVGLGCAEIWENVDDRCGADEERSELGCDRLTGHDSDFCRCAGPVTAPPETEPETAPYEDLFDELLGFGADTTGGRGGDVCTVTSTSNSGSGSLRNCVATANGPRWIRFSVDGDIRLNSNIPLPSDITIDARGHLVRIFGAGLTLNRRSNVIITNLTFKEGRDGDDQDAVQVKGGDKIWIHHCSFSDYSDGLVDLTKGTKDVTVSWSKFSDHDKVMLISANDNDTGDRNTRVTLHHNWFKDTKQRHPRVRHGKVHAYNNFFDNWGDYAMGCSTRSECYSERNVFQPGRRLSAIVTRVGEDRSDGEVESHGDLFLNGAFPRQRGSVFTPSDFYRYAADPTNGLAARIEANAGAR